MSVHVVYEPIEGLGPKRPFKCVELSRDRFTLESSTRGLGNPKTKPMRESLTGRVYQILPRLSTAGETPTFRGRGPACGGVCARRASPALRRGASRFYASGSSFCVYLRQVFLPCARL